MVDVISSWTDDRVSLLIKLWADGETGSTIARELGGVSRNGVIGKAHRLGLQTRLKMERKPVAPRIRVRRAKPAPMPWPPRKYQTLPKLYDEPVQECDDAAIPKRQRKTIFQLTNRTCRFPVGDPGTKGFFFCGGRADNANGQVYCAVHSARCFNGVPQRKRPGSGEKAQHEFRGTR